MRMRRHRRRHRRWHGRWHRVTDRELQHRTGVAISDILAHAQHSGEAEVPSHAHRRAAQLDDVLPLRRSGICHVREEGRQDVTELLPLQEWGAVAIQQMMHHRREMVVEAQADGGL